MLTGLLIHFLLFLLRYFIQSIIRAIDRLINEPTECISPQHPFFFYSQPSYGPFLNVYAAVTLATIFHITYAWYHNGTKSMHCGDGHCQLHLMRNLTNACDKNIRWMELGACVHLLRMSLIIGRNFVVMLFATSVSQHHDYRPASSSSWRVAQIFACRHLHYNCD